MDSTNFDKFKLTVDDDGYLKKRFCKIFEHVITNSFVFNEQLISDAKEILNSMKIGEFYKTDHPSYQLAFLLSFAVRDTCLSVRKFYESLKDHSRMISILSTKNRIKLCCLESESLPTVIGVCQIIDEIMGQFGSAGNFSEIQVSVFDKGRENWRRLCGSIVDTANCYFKNTELKLDFVSRWSSEELIDRVKESDLVVIARVCKLYLPFTRDSFMKVVLKEMKENAILFFFDSSSEKDFENIRDSVSATNFFSEIRCCKILYGVFEDLKEEPECLDLPINWDFNFLPIMYLTWIKHEEVKVNGIEKNEIEKFSDLVNQPGTPNEQTTVLKGEREVRSSKKLVDLIASDSEITESETSVEENKSHTASFPYFFYTQNDVETNNNVESLEKSGYVDASTIAAILQKIIPKGEYQAVSLTTFSKETFLAEETPLPTSKSKSASSKVPDAFEKMITKSKENSTIQVENKNVLVSPKKVVAPKKGKKKSEFNANKKIKNSKTKTSSKNASIPEIQKNLVTQLENGNVTPSIVKKTASKTGDADKSSVKPVKNNSLSETTALIGISKPKSNNTTGTASGTKVTASKKGDKDKPGEKSVKSNPATKTATLKVKSKTKSSNINFLIHATQKVQSKKVSRVQLTKKTSTNNATEKVRLTGKFARMDLEKRNKDERNRMKAKQASFLKHASFDYDD